MPKAVHDCVEKIKGKPGIRNPWAVCNASVRPKKAASSSKGSGGKRGGR